MAGIVVPIIQDPPFVAIVKEPINTNNPKPSEISSNDALMKVMLAEDLIPSEEESAGRVKALGKLNELVASFVKEAFAKNGHPDQYNEATSFRLRTFGSYRLDVHLPGADMDTVMLVPKHVLRSDMFMILYPMMSQHKHIKKLIKVEEARVPVIKFEMDGFEFDLAMSRFAGLSSLPEDFDVTDDRYLRHIGGDDIEKARSVTSLNGVRVTDTIRNLVPTMDTLKYCIRALKLWAKRRCVYKNVLGFLGGISIEILAARIGQLFPKALPAKLIEFFFRMYYSHKWPQAVGLTPINITSCDIVLDVWGMGAKDHIDRRHVMPIITPVFPAQNATANVSKSTLIVMKEEFERGKQICERIKQGNAEWMELFEPLDQFSKYTNYLQITAIAPSHVPISEGSAETRPSRQYYDMWKGYCEANVRAIVLNLERHPDAYVEHCCPFQRNYAKARSSEDEAYAHYWFVGVKFDKDRLKADGKKAPDIREPVNIFRNRIMHWTNRKEGMIVKIKSVKRSEIPDFVLNPTEEDGDLQKEQSIVQQLQTAEQKTEEEAPEQQGVSIALSLAEASAGVVASKKRGVEGEEREGAEVKRVKTESLSTTEGDVYMGKEEVGKEVKVKVEGVGRDVNSQGAGAGAGAGGGGEGVAAAAAAAAATAAAAVKTEASAVAAVTAAAATAAAAAAVVKEVKETDARSVTEELMAGLLRKPQAAERMAAQGNTAPALKRETFVLDAGDELRIEVDTNPVSLTLETGFAEVFGAEIPRGEAVRLHRQKLAVFTWQGATVSVLGEPKAVYKSEMREMRAYANLHGFLQQERAAARAAGAARTRGPRVMIVGPPDTGKTTLARVLLNYGVREGERPMLVDLDVSKTRHSFVAGSLAACTVTDILRPGDSLVESRGPLVYYYGFRDASHSPDLLQNLLKDMSARIEAREESLKASSGVIIDCFSYQAACKKSFPLVTFAARTLKAEVILVMDMDKLLCDLQKEFVAEPSVQVIKLAKCGGVVAHDKSFQSAIEKELLQDYFYGTMPQEALGVKALPGKECAQRMLCPRRVTLSFDQVQIYKTVPTPIAPQDALSFGTAMPEKRTEVCKIDPDASLENKMLAVAGHTPKQIQELTSINIGGFLHVQSVDVAAAKLTVLAPNGLPMPSNVLLQGDIEYVE